MNSKYLNSNPVEWLLEESDPSIRYLTRREILEDTGGADDWYARIAESPDIQRLMSRKGGLLGDTKHFDLFYKGSMWCFAESVERGLDARTPFMRETAEFLFSASQAPSGGFSLNWNPRHEVACRTGDMVRCLLRAGFYDERVDRAIEWIARTQRHDGGWLHCPIAGTCDQLRLILFKKPGKGLGRENDRGVTSCFYATIACAMALADHAGLTGSGRHVGRIAKAAEFFLNRSLYKDSRGAPIRPRGGWNPDFRRTGYPVMSQYDILYGLLFIAKAGLFADRRTGEAFNLVMSRQNDDGTWDMESAGTGMMYGNRPRGHVGKKSKWVTLQVLRLLKRAEPVTGAR